MIFTILICLVLVLSNFGLVASASPLVTSNKSQIQELLDYGFSKDDVKTLQKLLEIGFDVGEIETLPKDQFDRVKTTDNKIVSKVTKYYRITTDNNTGKNTVEVFNEDNYLPQYTKDMRARQNKDKNKSGLITSNSVTVINGDYSTSWMRLQTQIVYTSSGNYYSLYSFFTWLTKPSQQENDVLGIGISSLFSPIPNSEYFSYHATKTHYDSQYGTSTSTVYYSDGHEDNNGGYGVGFEFPLFQDWSEYYEPGYYMSDTYTNHAGYMYYRCNLNIASNPTYANAYGCYEHNYTIYDFSPSISFPWGGSLSLSSSSGFTAIHADAQVTVTH